MGLVDTPFCFFFWEGLYVRSAVEVCGIHDIHGIWVWDEEDRGQNVDHEIHGSNIVVMDDDPIRRLLFGPLLFLFDLLRDRFCSEFHWRDYKPALRVGLKFDNLQIPLCIK